MSLPKLGGSVASAGATKGFGSTLTSKGVLASTVHTTSKGIQSGAAIGSLILTSKIGRTNFVDGLKSPLWKAYVDAYDEDAKDGPSAVLVTKDEKLDAARQALVALGESMNKIQAELAASKTNSALQQKLLDEQKTLNAALQSQLTEQGDKLDKAKAQAADAQALAAKLNAGANNTHANIDGMINKLKAASKTVAALTHEFNKTLGNTHEYVTAMRFLASCIDPLIAPAAAAPAVAPAAAPAAAPGAAAAVAAK